MEKLAYRGKSRNCPPPPPNHPPSSEAFMAPDDQALPTYTLSILSCQKKQNKTKKKKTIKDVTDTLSLSPTDHAKERLRQLPGKCCTSFRKKSYQRKTALLLTKRCIQEWSSCQAVVQWVILPEGNQGEWDLSFHPKPPCLDKTIYIVYQKWLVILSNTFLEIWPFEI